jgi:hypothetical protein
MSKPTFYSIYGNHNFDKQLFQTNYNLGLAIESNMNSSSNKLNKRILFNKVSFANKRTIVDFFQIPYNTMATSIVTYQIINILGILIQHFNFDFDKYKINIIKLLTKNSFVFMVGLSSQTFIIIESDRV